MPSSWKCAACGLVNFATDANCKRCLAVNPTATVQPNVSSGIVLGDGYVMPPPPTTSGVWRDNKTLVMTKDATLPDQCVKCNAPANGFRLKRNLAWHHPVIFLVVLFNLIVYIVLAVALSKRATVYFGLCTEHIQRRRNLLFVGWVMMAMSLIGAFVAFANEYPGVGALALFLFIVAIFWLVIAARVAKVKKIDDRYVWLTGIDPQYLAQFPTVQSQY